MSAAVQYKDVQSRAGRGKGEPGLPSAKLKFSIKLRFSGGGGRPEAGLSPVLPPPMPRQPGDSHCHAVIAKHPHRSPSHSLQTRGCKKQ